ncbi:MAG: AtuA-related protein, partial [Acidimicrobiales bacterium]
MRRVRGRVKRKPGVRRARRVPLLALAHARSGDKGDTANVGLIALRAEDYPLLVKQVTA